MTITFSPPATSISGHTASGKFVYATGKWKTSDDAFAAVGIHHPGRFEVETSIDRRGTWDCDCYVEVEITFDWSKA
jgi:hypothetical protein